MRFAIALAVIFAPALAYAAHPFITEDPGTQGAGRFELEMGFASRQGDPDFDGRSNLFAPQLSIGVLDNVDLIAQVLWFNQSAAQGPTVIGSGDMLLDVKWRFYESETLALGVRAGLDLPTGDVNTGLGAGELGAHAIGIVGVTLGEFAIYANAVYADTRTPGARANLVGFSVALTRPDDAPLRGFVEAATYSNPDAGNPQWPAVARIGAIYTVVTGFDVDAGFQARLNRAATRAAWLVGATVRW